MADEKDKHTPESVAAKVVKALLNVPAKEKPNAKRGVATKIRRSKEGSG
jgi:hypothetical protein